MGGRAEITDAVHRLNRCIKRTSAMFVNDSFGRAQGRTLRLIAENDGLKASELATLLDISPSSMSEKLQKLEDDGNVTRKRDSKDLRVVRIFITENGRKALAKRSTATRRVANDFSKCLSEDEIARFVATCNRLCESLDEIHEAERKKLADFLKLQKKRARLAIR